ncbi:putative protease SohB [Candidatus Gullanella endobia]|uniref:Putative protease SohB n=1 Tax=Candidatus Gullanella endobia TaxID=1070130 RepID=A0A143WQY8_9ENTR|nr:protease SohB [Candidatus Gullanella endobia]CUX95967.1 putative protease SohB [Candidatus Gullanella endobia]
MEYFALYGLFLAKTITVVLVISTLLLVVFSLRLRTRQRKGQIKIENLSKQYRDRQREMQLARLSEAEKAIWHKKQKKQDKKNEAKQVKLLTKSGVDAIARSCLYVLDFIGSMNAVEVSSLREEITSVLSVAKSGDKVLLRLESPGGVVHGYGLAASQLQRLRKKGIQLIITVDKIAASGGYMMACVADQIITAPFAIIGSIGVVAQIPNFNRLLKRNDIDIELHTAGTYKRTLTLFGENSSSGREKFQQELNETHQLFKSFVKCMRPNLDIDAVSTGEHWYGEQALHLGLVDAIGTSDEFLIEQLENHEVISVRFTRPKRWMSCFTDNIILAFDQLFLSYWQYAKKLLYRKNY